MEIRKRRGNKKIDQPKNILIEEEIDDKKEHPKKFTQRYSTENKADPQTQQSTIQWLWNSSYSLGCYFFGNISYFLSGMVRMIPTIDVFKTILSLANPRESDVQIDENTQRRIDQFKLFISEKYDEKNNEHEETLKLLWDLSFEDKAYTRISKDWGKIGFQGNNPATDFRGCGYFGLCNLIYFSKTYEAKYKSMIKGRIKEDLRNFPVAIASLNVIMLIYQILGWGMKKGQQVDLKCKSVLINLFFSQDHKWVFYNGEDVNEDEDNEDEDNEGVVYSFNFEKVFSLAFMILDDLWYQNNANYMQFPIILEKTFVKLQQVLVNVDSILQVDKLIDDYLKL
eukprot:TRINITY_DN4680_c0_g1_i1.p1 TRINITY_DN4680_c0_g1~~TRINITY_DN4680_c0_g1_i1.p1  ORF type:complete len:339 (+),score=84.55 TRINITY_DN4680_c0_g1_i1:28-1044(+)